MDRTQQVERNHCDLRALAIVVSVAFCWLQTTPQPARASEAGTSERELILEVFDEDGQVEPETEARLSPPPSGHRYQLVEVYTANNLQKGEYKLGQEVEYGISERVSVGTDTPALIVGIPSFNLKWSLGGSGSDRFAIGLLAAWFTLDTVVRWAPIHSQYDRLEARMLKPSIAWSHHMSPRLSLHTYWTAGIGSIDARLSEEGKRRAWEQKHPGGDYDQRETESTTDSATGNRETASTETSDVTRRALEMQSVFGLSTDSFQVTGEYTRASGHKVLVTSRIERLVLENLRARTFRITVAQQWIQGAFQFRLGLGALYMTISGIDLDGEEITDTNDARVLPVSDISFYWRI